LKTCSKCKEEKEDQFFCKDKRRKDGLHPQCKLCVSTYSKNHKKKPEVWKKVKEQSGEWKRSNPDKVRAQAVKKLFGLSWEDYLQKYAEQDGSCAICKTHLILYGDRAKTDKIANVDHNHTTKQIRGLLCRKCNTAIGLLQDNITVIKNASEYLERYTNE